MHPTKLWDLFLILLLAAFGAEMAYLATLDQSLWGDEIYCLWATPLSWSEIIDKDPGNPPLYPLILKAATALIGLEAWKLKLVSVLPTALAAIIGACFLRREFSLRAAILFVLCLAATWMPAHYAIEVRAYGWAFFFVLMTALSAWSVGKNGRRRDWAQFLFFATCAAFTHYYALLTCAWGYLLLFGYVAKYDRRQIRAALLTAAGAALAFGWYVPAMLAGDAKSPIGWIPPVDFAAIAGYARDIFTVGTGDEASLAAPHSSNLFGGEMLPTTLLAIIFGAVALGTIRRSENAGGEAIRVGGSGGVRFDGGDRRVGLVVAETGVG
ncbi:MAG: glycosyltransferase family 39 protein [Planctomycetota bacterium]|nr:glycosyltransferase family 39 protein [Planctomycetota bacterium]